MQSVVLFILFAGKVESKVRPTRLNKYLKDSQEKGGNIPETGVKYERSSLSQLEAKREAEDLLRYMREEKPYLDPDLTLQNLAEKLNMTRNHLSQVLNEYCGLKFYDFINSFRVEEAKSMMMRNYLQNNILQTAFDAGFNSKTTFYAAFKKAIGLSPSEYLHNLKKNEVLVQKSSEN